MVPRGIWVRTSNHLWFWFFTALSKDPSVQLTLPSPMIILHTDYCLTALLWERQKLRCRAHPEEFTCKNILERLAVRAGG